GIVDAEWFTVLQPIVSFAANQEVVAGAALGPIVAAIEPDDVVAGAAPHDIGLVVAVDFEPDGLAQIIASAVEVVGIDHSGILAAIRTAAQYDDVAAIGVDVDGRLDRCDRRRRVRARKSHHGPWVHDGEGA